ncbi:MAG: glycine zipper 2TM domain-containing protein [Alphaproteobacteria bacterium]|nr:glycine zipper 2TM domain-containing protein [Alphaproteobacteria bacterium]
MQPILKHALLAMSMVTMAVSATPALADRDKHDERRDGRHDRRDHYRDHDNGRHLGQRKHNEVRYYRNYDWNRPDPSYRGYYADRYYRDGYATIRVTRSTRIYRGHDDRYYCRRSDGTTGLIIGAAVGGTIGNSLDRGHSSVLGTILGAGTGALLGREIDRGGVSCR